MWRDLGKASLTANAQRIVTSGVRGELVPLDEAAMVRSRDDILLTLLRLKAASSNLP